jgi:hypothetical protein
LVKPLAEDPAGAIQRVGDVLVWNGSNGRTVLATLESLSDGQERIEQVVNRIETLHSPTWVPCPSFSPAERSSLPQCQQVRRPCDGSTGKASGGPARKCSSLIAVASSGQSPRRPDPAAG